MFIVIRFDSLLNNIIFYGIMKSYACLLRRGTYLCMIINKILFILVMIDLVTFDEAKSLK